MWTAVTGGILIGWGVSDWLGRLVLPALVAVVACIELLFLRVKNSKKFDDAGMDEASKRAFLDMGMGKWGVYKTQFLWTYTVTLVVTLITSGIRFIMS